MTEEKKQKLTAARAKVDKANKWRLTFLFIAVLFLLFIFLGGKFFEQTPWFQTAKQWIYFITGWDLIFVLISTLIQFYFTIKYNKIVKS